MITRQILRLIIYYLMPLIFITIFYSLIAKTLFQTKETIYSPTVLFKTDSLNEESRRMRPNRETFSYNQTLNTLNQDARARRQLHARHKVAKTVLFLCLVFFICWLPKQLHDLYWYVLYEFEDLMVFFILGLLVFLFIHHLGIISGKLIKQLH